MMAILIIIILAGVLFAVWGMVSEVVTWPARSAPVKTGEADDGYKRFPKGIPNPG